jgi:hypothetical protein
MTTRKTILGLSLVAILSGASAAYAQEREGFGGGGIATSGGFGTSSMNFDRGGSPPTSSESFSNPETSGSSGTSTTTGGAGRAGLPPR